MPRQCTVCGHPDRITIDKALIDGASLRTIANRFGTSVAAMQRHKTGHLARLVADAVRDPVSVQHAAIGAHAEQRTADERNHAIDILSELARQIQRVNMLSDAVDTWLRDPEDPTRYTVDTRAEEISVVYLDWSGDAEKPTRRRAKLSHLLEEIETKSGGRYLAEKGETRHADPRELLVKAADGLRGQLQLLLTVLEKIYNAQEIESFMAAVLDAIAEVAPDARVAIIENLRRQRPLRGAAGTALG